MQENQVVGTELLNFVATDPDPGATLSFSLSDLNATTQNGLFSIDANGTLRNQVIFDFENNSSNYLIRVRVTDQHNAFREEEFIVELQNVNEPLTVLSYDGVSHLSLNRLEGLTSVAFVAAEDPDSNLTYSLNGGSDVALFSLNSITGELSFLNHPDFEVRLDSDSGNDYEVSVRVSDGSFHADQNFTINLINTEDPPQIDLLGVSAITATSALIEANMSAFSGGNDPQVVLHYDDNTSYHSARPDPFVPYNLNGRLSLWLDANESSTITHESGSVSQWGDKSGNFHWLAQDVNTSKPTTGAFNHNGMNVISFDGDDFLTRNYSNILYYDQTWFVVAQIDTGGVNHAADALLCYGGGNDGRWELRANNVSSFNSKIAKNSSWLQGTLTRFVSFDNYHLFSISFDRSGGALLSNWVNGEIRTNGLSDSLGLAEKQKINLMAGRSSPPQTLGEKLQKSYACGSTAPSDRQKVEGYLAHKWDLNASLDPSHPYLIDPPTQSQPISSINLGSKQLGNFSHLLNGLSPSTTYHYRFWRQWRRKIFFGYRFFYHHILSSGCRSFPHRLHSQFGHPSS